MCSFLKKGYFLEHVFFAVLLLFRPSLSSLKWWCLDRLLKGANIKRTQTFLCTVFLIKDPRRPMACTFFGSTSHPGEIIVISYLNHFILVLLCSSVGKSPDCRHTITAFESRGVCYIFRRSIFLKFKFSTQKNNIYFEKDVWFCFFFSFCNNIPFEKEWTLNFYNLYSTRHKDAL